MAMYHFSIKMIGRSEGRSAVACASYRAGEKLLDERLGRSFEFKRQDRVAHREIIAPDFAPEGLQDRGELWNSVEAAERRKDAQLSREFQVALPLELTLAQQRELISEWVREQLTPLGVVADVAIHKAPLGANPNDHFHLMSTTRSIEVDGSWSKTKDRSLNSPEQLDQWRASWADHANRALEKAGHDARIDHRSNRARGIETEPTIHEGYASQAIEARGGHSWRAEFNRQIRKTNQQILAEIKAKATQAANAVKRAATANFRELAQRLARSPAETAPKPAPKAVPKPVLQPQRMRPDKLAESPVDTAPKPVLQPILQPQPMRPDKLAGGPEPTPASKKQEPAPAPIAAKPQPAKLPEMLPPAIPDAEAAKLKKAAHLAALIQRGGGGIGG
jgi:hypothetical protein